MEGGGLLGVGYGSDSDSDDSDHGGNGGLLGVGTANSSDSEEEQLGLLMAGSTAEHKKGVVILDEDDGAVVSVGGARSRTTAALAGQEEDYLLQNSDVWGFRLIPPTAPGPTNPVVKAKIQKSLEQTRQGNSFNQELQRNATFQNPSYYEHMAHNLGLFTHGTNYDPQVYSPVVDSKDTYDFIVQQQKHMEDIRAEKRKQREALQFTNGGLLPAHSALGLHTKRIKTMAKPPLLPKPTSRWGQTIAVPRAISAMQTSLKRKK